MPAYWVARSKINDPVEYKKYTDLVPAIIAKHGGKVLARGGKFQIMEGPQKFQRFVVIEFPTFEQGVACFTSDEYNKAAHSAAPMARAKSRPSWSIAATRRSDAVSEVTPRRAARRRLAAVPARRRRSIR